MFCDRCGRQLSQPSPFCPNCGRALGATPLAPLQGRIAGHVRLLGILWLAASAFRLIPGMVLMAMSVALVLPPDVPEIVHAIFTVLGGFFLAGAVLGGITGWGLLTRQPWARMLAIVYGGINLADLPFGTALGIYTLWVLLPAASEQEYRVSAQAA
jgi:hypothetical protein